MRDAQIDDPKGPAMPLVLDLTLQPFGAARDAEPAVKTCTACGEVKPLEGFSRQSNAPLGRRTQCKMCRAKRDASRRADPKVRERRAETDRAWYDANRDHVVERVRAWARANPGQVRAQVQRRRARRAQATVEPFTPADLAAHYEDLSAYDCSVCSLPMTTPDDNTDEHVVPLASDGAHALSNLLPAHFACNSSKNTTPALEAWERRTAWVGRRDPAELLRIADRLTAIQDARRA